MARVFAYCRVSTTDQSPENQIMEIKAAGFSIEDHRVVFESISGSVDAFARPRFAKLVDRLEATDILVVTKLDRLGRDAINVRSTVEKLSSMGVKVHCLALGGADLTSPAGKMTMQVIAAVAEFERDLLIERTQAGLLRAKKEGKSFGRPSTFTDVEQQQIFSRITQGEAIAAIAKSLGTTRQTIMRIRSKWSSDSPLMASDKLKMS